MKSEVMGGVTVSSSVVVLLDFSSMAVMVPGSIEI